MNTELKHNAQAVNSFDDFEQEKVSLIPFEQLKTGWHQVVVAMILFTDDRFKGLRNPTMKADSELPEWSDPTAQLAIYFEGENRRGATRRFSRHGYMTFEDVLKESPVLANDCYSSGTQGYAVDKANNVRLISDEKTKKAEMILKRFLTAAGVPEGTKGSALASSLQDAKLQVEIGMKQFKGKDGNTKDYYEVINFAHVDTPAAELTRVPRPSNIMDELPETV